MHRGVRRTAAAVALSSFVPVPLLDTWVQNRARRWLVREVAQAEELELSDAQVIALADVPLLPLQRAALWPVKLLLKKVFFVFAVVDAGREAHRVLSLPERCREEG